MKLRTDVLHNPSLIDNHRNFVWRQIQDHLDDIKRTQPSKFRGPWCDILSRSKDLFAERIDFSRLDLRDMTFEGASLENINFDYCQLSLANFNRATVFKCSFREATLSGASFVNSEISECDFSQATLQAVQVDHFFTPPTFIYAKFTFKTDLVLEGISMGPKAIDSISSKHAARKISLMEQWLAHECTEEGAHSWRSDRYKFVRKEPYLSDPSLQGHIGLLQMRTMMIEVEFGTWFELPEAFLSNVLTEALSQAAPPQWTEESQVDDATFSEFRFQSQSEEVFFDWYMTHAHDINLVRYQASKSDNPSIQSALKALEDALFSNSFFREFAQKAMFADDDEFYQPLYFYASSNPGAPEVVIMLTPDYFKDCFEGADKRKALEWKNCLVFKHVGAADAESLEIDRYNVLTVGQDSELVAAFQSIRPLLNAVETGNP